MEIKRNKDKSAEFRPTPQQKLLVSCRGKVILHYGTGRTIYPLKDSISKKKDWTEFVDPKYVHKSFLELSDDEKRVPASRGCAFIE